MKCLHSIEYNKKQMFDEKNIFNNDVACRCLEESLTISLKNFRRKKILVIPWSRVSRSEINFLEFPGKKSKKEAVFELISEGDSLMKVLRRSFHIKLQVVFWLLIELLSPEKHKTPSFHTDNEKSRGFWKPFTSDARGLTFT